MSAVRWRRVAWAVVACQWTVNLGLHWSAPCQLVRGMLGVGGLLLCFSGSSLLLVCFAHPRLAQHRLPLVLSVLSLLIASPSALPLAWMNLVQIHFPIHYCRVGGIGGCTDYYE